MNQPTNQQSTSGKLLLQLLLTLIFVAAASMSARAATLTVTNTNDSGAGSLRQAITDAASGDTIQFDSTVFATAQTINLASGQLTITKSLTITGTGANKLTIGNVTAASSTSRIFNITSAAGTVNLSELTVTGGNSTATYGGGILCNANLTLNSVHVTGNTIPYNGGGIGSTSSGAVITIINSTVSNNTLGALGSFGGGGIFSAGTLNITNSTVSGNNANNRRGGGIFAYSGSTTITNSTITDNSTTAASSDTASGIYATAPVTVRNSIIAANRSNSTYPDVTTAANGGLNGTFTSNGYNIIGNPGSVTTFNQTGDQVGSSGAPLNPRLAPLANNGGATQTQALLSGSPAINTGTATGAPATDQRGAARVGATDIGAFELNNTTNGGNYRAALSGKTGTSFNYQLTQNSGAFTYSKTSGTLPPGLSIANALTAAGAYSIQGTPTQGGTYFFTVTASDGTNTNATDYTITISGAPTAAGASLGGRVRTANGRGITNITVTVYGGNLRQPRTVTTSSFGYYRFADLAAGQTYILEVRGKRYTFRQPTRVVSLADNALGEDFIAEQ